MKIKPTQEQLKESYARLKSVRKVGQEFSYTGEGIRGMMHEYGLEIKIPNKQAYTCNDEFFSIDNEESFYIAGFMAADGCVKKHSGKNQKITQFYIQLAKKDELHLLKMQYILKSNHIIKTHITKNSERNPEWNDSEKRELCITSERLCNDLKKFNIIPRKTHIYTFPEWLINHPLVHHFMRGYNDGDGSFFVNKGVNTPQVYFSLRGTPSFLTTYRSILERECGLEPRTKTVRVNTGIGVLEYGGNGVVTKIAGFLYRDATIMLDRKYQIVKELIL